MKRKITSVLLFIMAYLCIEQTIVAQTKNDMIFWGIFEEGLQGNLTKVKDYGTQLGKSPSMVMWYIGWNASGDHTFPLATCQQVAAAGYVPHIVWEPWLGLDPILAGDYDSDIQKFGEDIAKFEKPVMLRFGHEFNGDWYPWSYISGAVVPASKWIQAYKYVHDKVIAAGGTNAVWLWSPNNGNGGNNPQDITDYYPGSEYVDWIAIDGYNWGTSQTWSSWALFSDVFGSVYQKIISNYPDKPVMLGEMGCTSTGGDKAAWITDMFEQLKNNFTHIKAFVWFNVNKETDWRFNTTTESTEAFKTALSDTTVKYDINLLNSLADKTIKISGKKKIVPGEVNTMYSISPYSEIWNIQWETTGTAHIIGATNNDTVIVDWGCDADTLKCNIIRSFDTIQPILIATLVNTTIESPLFADSLQSNIELKTQVISGATYNWMLPQDVSFSGIQDSSVVLINWSERTDTIKLEISSTCGILTAEKIIYLKGRYPYPNPAEPHELPGIIESNEYDYGGEGIAYHDADTQNKGTGSRSDEGVDTEPNDGGEYVGWVSTDEWLTYTVKVTTPGTYFTELRVASLTSGGKLTILLNNEDALTNIDIGSTGGWSTFKSIFPGTIDLTATDTIMKYFFNTGNFNIGRLFFWEIDNEAPVKPESLNGVVALNSINLSWNKATDNQKLYGYNVFVNGTFKIFVTDTIYSLTGLTKNTLYKIGVTAIDIQNNESDTLKGDFTTLATYINQSASDNEFELYPNPVTYGNSITIKVPNTLNNTNSVIKIYDMYGRVLYNKPIESGETLINTSNICKQGIYNVQIINGIDNVSKLIFVK
jgi:hypothetical protein